MFDILANWGVLIGCDVCQAPGHGSLTVVWRFSKVLDTLMIFPVGPHLRVIRNRSISDGGNVTEWSQMEGRVAVIRLLTVF